MKPRTGRGGPALHLKSYLLSVQKEVANYVERKYLKHFSSYGLIAYGLFRSTASLWEILGSHI